MRTLLLLTLALVATAHADTIISTGLLDLNPDIYEFPLMALCTVTNVSSKLVTVNSVRFLHEDGTEYVQRDFPSNCSYPNPILPGLACIHRLGKFELPSSGYIRCEVNVGKGSPKSLRVTLEMNNPYEASPSSRPPTIRTDVGR